MLSGKKSVKFTSSDHTTKHDAPNPTYCLSQYTPVGVGNRFNFCHETCSVWYPVQPPRHQGSGGSFAGRSFLLQSKGHGPSRAGQIVERQRGGCGLWKKTLTIGVSFQNLRWAVCSTHNAIINNIIWTAGNGYVSRVRRVLTPTQDSELK